ncbi:hypothetical protein Avbf_14342 [Armadillidium vulgare]|nr:hypothetical protein Avbf_14342 [Armadillidium vulgare]
MVDILRQFNYLEITVKEELKEDFASEFVKVVKEIESGQEKWFEDNFGIQISKVSNERVTGRGVEVSLISCLVCIIIYLRDVRNCDLEKSLPQFKDGKDISGEVSGAGEKSLRNDKYSINNSVSESERSTKNTTTSCGNTHRFKCSFCSSVFKYPGHLDNHILTTW